MLFPEHLHTQEGDTRMAENSVLNIMLAFVSLVQENNVKEPIYYPDINGKPYTAIQTNESAIIAVQRQLENNPLSSIFLVCSEKVRTSSAPQTDEYGIVTHINFLKKRLIQADNRLSNKIIDLGYYDDLDNIEESMRNVTQIAGTIMNYAHEHPGYKLRLYADMTGGFRYNSTMMLVIMQLLQFNGIELGKVLYSDPAKKRVFDATSLLGLFSLISGADEFIRFGSVETLQDYFTNTPKTQELDNLLQAMQRFSDAIKMCRTSLIKDELRTLNVYLQAFKEHHGNTLQENLFASIIMTLQNEYGALLEGQATEFDIIRWCERKGFLQQAMTLCTEWLPSYLVSNKIAYTDEPGIMLICEQVGRKTGRSWQQYFITVYPKGSKRKKIESDKITLAELIKASILSGNKNMNGFDITQHPKLNDLHEEIKKADFDFILIKSGMLPHNDFAKKYPMLGNIMQITYKESCQHSKKVLSYKDYIYRISMEQLIYKLTSLPDQEIYALFEVSDKDYNMALETREKMQSEFMDIEVKWDKTEQRYHTLYKNGLLKSRYRYNDMLKCLHDYFLIRTERNHINHANAESITSKTEIRELILNTLTNWTALTKDILTKGTQH